MSIIEIFLKPEVIWFIIGLALLISEFILPGVVIIFFGIGAWVTTIFILIFGISLNYQLVVFISTSLLSLALLRKFIKTLIYNRKGSDLESILEEFIGKTAVVQSEIKLGSQGKIEFKGSNWEAVSDQEIKKGEVVKIISKDSIVMKVERIKIKKPEEK
ncbi:MAG: NfeD family protein [Candidatus Marinimicrobia bacterium]|nr:NfeD family protein [Candidatus Neomarinimicrobiota bacterium]TFB13258.1 NfeD family protein [Candidatus Marinimicrobia bacterium MT.SAG.4]